MVKYEAQLDSIFMALAHPARRTMLARLGKGEATVGELAQPLDMSLPAVTKHLKVLAAYVVITIPHMADLAYKLHILFECCL